MERWDEKYDLSEDERRQKAREMAQEYVSYMSETFPEVEFGELVDEDAITEYLSNYKRR